MFICPTRKSLNFANIVQESEKVRQAVNLKLIDAKGVISATTGKVGVGKVIVKPSYSLSLPSILINYFCDTDLTIHSGF